MSENESKKLLQRIDDVERRLENILLLRNKPEYRIQRDLQHHNIHHFRLYNVPKDYYSEQCTLEIRAKLLNCNIDQLCKTIVFENTVSDQTENSDITYSRYNCVVVQYVAKINSTLLRNFIHELKPPEARLSKKKFNFQLADENTSFQLTGFEHNAVCPFGMINNNKLPIIFAESSSALPNIIFLGGGNVFNKLSIDVDEVLKKYPNSIRAKNISELRSAILTNESCETLNLCNKKRIASTLMSNFTSRPHQIPMTVVGEEGSSKRNILRKNSNGTNSSRGGRKELVIGKSIDDGSLAPGPVALDKNDPNYDSEEELTEYSMGDEVLFLVQNREEIGQSKMTLTCYKKSIEPIIKEFFISGEIHDVEKNLIELNAREYSYEFVKKVLNMSLDKGDREKELVSKLFSNLYPDLLSSNCIGKGFERLFELVDEIEKDAPYARQILTTYLARAVIDEVLPPSYLNDAVICNLGGDIVENAKRKLSDHHAGTLLEKVWGPGDGRPVEELKVSIDQLLVEYVLSCDIDEAVRCVKELNAPLFLHEVVKRAVSCVMDRSEEDQKRMSNLLLQLHVTGTLSNEQLLKGFNRLVTNLSDLTLDTPHAPQVLEQFVLRAKESNLLSDQFHFSAELLNDPIHSEV